MRFLLALLGAFAVSAHAQPTVRVFAADSLRPAFDEIAAQYPSASISMVYGAPAALRDRISAGERPALFASTSVAVPHSLTRDGLAGPVKRFARGGGSEYGLVLVAGSGQDAFNFSQFLLSPEAQSILRKHGYAPGASALLAGY